MSLEFDEDAHDRQLLRIHKFNIYFRRIVIILDEFACLTNCKNYIKHKNYGVISILIE